MPQDQSMAFFKTLSVAAVLLAMPLAAQAPKPAVPGAVNASNDGTTPLHLAVRSGDVVGVQSLLKSGANPSVANRYGISPLFLAAENANAEVISLLVKAGADTKATLPGGQTLLMTAARSGNPAVVKLLLD